MLVNASGTVVQFLSYEGVMTATNGPAAGMTSVDIGVSEAGTEAVGNEATPEQLDAMKRLLAESIEAGGLGFSSSQAYTHSDGDGEPVPSRHATQEEVLALCEKFPLYPGL